MSIGAIIVMLTTFIVLCIITSPSKVEDPERKYRDVGLTPEDNEYSPLYRR